MAVSILVTLVMPILHLLYHQKEPSIKESIKGFVSWLLAVFAWIAFALQLYSLRPDWFAIDPWDLNLLYTCIILGVVSLFTAYIGFIEPHSFDKEYDEND